MDSQYYKDYYHFERNHWWFKARLKILDEYISKNIYKGYPLQILNIGAATGATSEMLSKFGEVVSVEYNQECIDFVFNKTGVKFEQGDICNLKYAENQFDFVCAFDVIEHVKNDQEAVNEVLRVCKQGCDILVTVPANMSLWSMHDVINHHYRRYKCQELVSLFSKAKYTNKQLFISYFNSVLFFPIFIARKFGNLIDKLKSNRNLISDFSKFKPILPLNNLLYRLMQGESHLLTQKKKLAIGVSLIIHTTKKNQ